MTVRPESEGLPKDQALKVERARAALADEIAGKDWRGKEPPPCRH